MNHLQEFLKKPPHGPFYAVIGHPLAHSKSPLIHNIALQHHNMKATYYAIDTPSNAFAWIGKLLSLPGFRGLNVTIPHKSRIIEPLDIIDPLAIEVGAVNTVATSRNGLIGYNTDVTGFVQSLLPHALMFAGQPGVVMGSGGAARAAVASFRDLKMTKAFVVSRRPAATDWPAYINKVPVQIIGYNQLESAIAQCGAVINTTPLGMQPDIYKSPVPPDLTHLLKGKVCMDAIYNPLETQFMKQADIAGAHSAIGGLTMFVEQAAASFRIWTGKSFPKEEAAKAIREQLLTR